MTSRAQIALKKRAKEDAANNTLVIKTLMSQVDGRRWAWLKMAESAMFVDTENLDPQVLAYKAGRRNQGLGLFKEILDSAPDMFVRMWQENSTKAPEEPEEQNDD